MSHRLSPWHLELRLITLCWSQLKHTQLHTASTEQVFSLGHLSQGKFERGTSDIV